MALFGQAEAAALGYQVSSRGGSGTVTYVKDGVYLTIYPAKTATDAVMAELSFVAGILTVSTGRFSWPHPHFAALFERQIRRAKALLDQEGTDG